MIPHAAQFIAQDDLVLFSRIKKAVELMHTPDLGVDERGKGIVLSCHILARAVAKLFPVHVRDGKFAISYCHSWVETPHENLIDVYPVSVIGGPIMFDGNRLAPQANIYKRSSPREISRTGRIPFSSKSFRRSVRRVTRALREVMV